VSTVAKTARFVWEQMKVNVLAAMEYRVSFLTQVVFMLLNDILLLFFWWVLFQRFDEVAGWQQHDVFLLYAMVAGTFGLASAIFGNTGRLSTIIAEGQLDYYLALPKDVWLNVLISRSSASAIGDFVFAFTLCIFLLGFSVQVLLAVLCMLIAAVLYTALVAMAHSLSFYLGNAEQIASLFSEAIMNFGLYPISIFSLTVRVLFFTVIPVAFISYVPVTLVRNFTWPLFALFLAATVLGVSLSRWVFYAGLRRYESGNLVAPRM